MLSTPMFRIPMKRSSVRIGLHSTSMQNKKFVRIVIWVVVVSMVIGLGFTVFALLS